MSVASNWFCDTPWSRRWSWGTGFCDWFVWIDSRGPLDDHLLIQEQRGICSYPQIGSMILPSPGDGPGGQVSVPGVPGVIGKAL